MSARFAILESRSERFLVNTDHVVLIRSLCDGRCAVELTDHDSPIIVTGSLLELAAILEPDD